jgi:hypothetical protein
MKKRRKSVKKINTKKEKIIFIVFVFISLIPILWGLISNFTSTLGFFYDLTSSLLFLAWFIFPYALIFPILFFTSYPKVISRIITPLLVLYNLFAVIYSMYFDTSSSTASLEALVVPVLIGAVAILLLIIFGVIEMILRYRRKPNP